MDKKQFLSHLAGLRGLAIIFVVLFHMNGEAWSHGYLGVDVFLVMTGYLLFRSRFAEEGMTSIRGGGVYLLKRIQRIVPPMLIVIIITAGLGLYFMWWPDALFTGRLGEFACYVKANMMLKREFEDYFATDSAFVPLLHLWYLSLTLQVYLIYTVANQLMQRLPKVWIASLLIVLGVASMIWCYNVSLLEGLSWIGLNIGEGKAVSYYQTLPRLWEVMAGGLVCVLPECRRALHATLCTVLGLLLILLPALSGTVPGLGGIAQLPCTLIVVIGTILCLRYAPASHVQSIFSNKPLVWLGGISFSLYLVHMPIIVFMRMWVMGEVSVLYSLLMLFVCLVAAVVFWYGVEKRRAAWWLVVLMWVATILFCREIRRTEAFRSTLPQGYWEMPSYEEWRFCKEEALIHDWDWKKFPFFDGAFHFTNQLSRVPKNPDSSLLCMGDESKKATSVLIGDSHAAHAYAGLDCALREKGLSGVYLASYVYPLYGCRKSRKMRVVHELNLFQWLKDNPQITHVIIAQRWWDRLERRSEIGEKASGLRRFLQELKAIGKQPVIIGPTPEFGRQAPIFHYDKILTLRNMSAENAENFAAVCTRESYLKLNRRVLPLLEELKKEGLCTVVEPLSALEPGEVFHTFSGRKMLMTDSHHLGAAQSIWLMHRLADDLKAQLQPAAE